MQDVCKASVVIYNMIVEMRRDGYKIYGTAGRSQYFESEKRLRDIVFTESSPGSTFMFAQAMLTVSDDINKKGIHFDLLRALVTINGRHLAKTKIFF